MMFTINSSKFRSSQFIRTHLMSIRRVRELVGEKIYPTTAPQVDGEYIIITRTGYERRKTKSGVYETMCEVAVEVFSDDYDTALDIAEAISDEVEKAEFGAIGNQVVASLMGAVESADAGKFIQSLIFEIK